MRYKIEQAPLSEAGADHVAVFVFQGDSIHERLKQLDKAFSRRLAPLGRDISSLCREENYKGKASQFFSLPTYGQTKARRLQIIGLGRAADLTTAIVRKAGANLARRLATNNSVKSVAVYFPDKVAEIAQTSPASARRKAVGKAVAKSSAAKAGQPKSQGEKSLNEDFAQAFVEGWHLGSYSFDKYKSKSNSDGKKEKSVTLISIYGLKTTARAFEEKVQLGQAMAEATNFSRRLIAEPPSFMTPTRLAEEAKGVAREFGLTVKVLDLPQIEKLSMGALLGVARGAKEAPKFIVLSYEAPRAKKKVAIVGKGITFDSGGLSLKPPNSMEHMKYDMSGAAAVIGAMRVVGRFKPAVSVLAVVAATENMPGDAAMHPGDVLKSMNGKTIEVNNTDAEGRLVLADALTYAIKQGADELIDIATLTGAVVTALGRVAAGIMGSDQNLVDALIKSGGEAGEKLWQLPLFDEYHDSLKSDIADLKNAGSRGEAGSASAGMFLKEFTAGKPWAHMDIAGPGWIDKDRDELNKGGTAFGVRTLCRYLLSLK